MTEVMTQEDKDAILIDNIIAREQEVHAYQVNIDNYMHLLDKLPSKWPADLEPYRTLSRDALVEQVPVDRMQEVSSLIFRDQIERRVKTEILEQTKSQHIYDALVATFSDPAALADKLAAAVAVKTLK